MKAVRIATIALGMVIAFAAGYLTARPRPLPQPSPEEISRAQEAANKLLPPLWADMFEDQPWFKSVRRNGYRYCYRNGSIDAACARNQDAAIQSAFFAIEISKEQQKMADHSRLSLREQEVARNPKLRESIVRHCFGLYAEHGRKDARLLAVCLGNLSEFSPLVSIPPE